MGWSEARKRMMNRLHARTGGRSRPVEAFTSQPEPRSLGIFARGRQILAGNLLFAGHLVEPKGQSIWDVPAPSVAFSDELHGFVWLDDLVAVGDAAARQKARDWTLEWVHRYGQGQGPGWPPDVTGRRVMRLVNHAVMLMQGMDRDQGTAMFATLARQTLFLSRRWKSAQPGLPRFEALCGLVCAALSLEGVGDKVDDAQVALGSECALRIDAGGGIPSRNPEELLEVFTLLTWAQTALTQSGKVPVDPLLEAIGRIAPGLRALRHADGGLARFHGGGRGADGRLEAALAASGVRQSALRGLAMGFARLAAGRTTVIVDASAPPKGRASAQAHASTLAFEMTSGRRPLLVNCGPGALFGADWHRGARATPSQTVLGLEGFSSSRFGKRREDSFAETPIKVRCQASLGENREQRLTLSHDGYLLTHGLMHLRELELAPDGRSLAGSDTLLASTAAERRRVDRVLQFGNLEGIPYSLRFHLHPDVDATLDMGGTAVSMALRSGEIWIFRYNGVGDLTLQPSVYMETGRLKPRPTRQIQILARLTDYAAQVSWTLSKAQDTPSALRDTIPADPETDEN